MHIWWWTSDVIHLFQVCDDNVGCCTDSLKSFINELNCFVTSKKNRLYLIKAVPF